MIDWTPEAIEAAHRAMFQEPYDGTTAAMIGAGLDAAAASQGMPTDSAITILRGQVEALNNERDRLWSEKLITQGEITRLREENARMQEDISSTIKRMSKLDFERTAAEIERDDLRKESARLAALSAKASLEASQLRKLLFDFKKFQQIYEKAMESK